MKVVYDTDKEQTKASKNKRIKGLVHLADHEMFQSKPDQCSSLLVDCQEPYCKLRPTKEFSGPVIRE